MASSGDFITNNAWGGGYPGAVKFSWWVISQSIEGNYTDIGFSITATGGNNSWGIWHYSPSLWVDGANYTNSSAYRVQGETYITDTKRIYHNDDGTKTFSASFSANIYYAGSNPTSGSGSWSLPTIARKSSPTTSASEISIPATSGSITITTNRKSSSFTHTITLKVGNTTIATKTGVGANTSFNLADIDDAILATIPSANSATVTVNCETFNGSTSIGSNSTTFTAKVNDTAAPEFSDFGYSDTNSATTAITGNNQVLISGKSTLTATISTSQKATAKYSATMSSYTFTINGQTQTQAYSTSAITKNLGAVTLATTVTANTSKDLVIAAIDSRSKSTAVSKSITVVPYAAPVVNASATRQNGFENTTTIKIGGTVSRIEVNGTAKNTVNASSGVQYRYKAASTTTWGSWTSRASTLDTSTGKITTTDFSLNLDNQTAYDFEVKITDRLETTTASFQVSVGQPAFYIGEDGRIGIGGMPTIAKIAGEQGLLDVKGRIFTNGREVGTGGDLPDNIVLWDEEQSTPEPETPWVTKSMVDFDSFGIFSNDIAITNGSVRVARFGKFGIILGKSINFTYTGTYNPVSVTIPTSVLPTGATVLQTQATTCSHTVDDNQWTHGIGSMTAGASGTTLSFPLLSGNSVSKSCAVAFVLFFIEQ